MNAQFEISQLKASIESLITAYPELAEDEILRADMFEAETNINNVLSTLVDKALDAATTQDAIALRQKDLAARKARYGKQEDALRGFMLSIMELADLKKATLPEATLSISFQKPKLMVADETLLNEDMKKTVITISPDMDKIKEAYEFSQKIPDGVMLTNGKNILRVLNK
jgi:hypothetical protein